MNYKYKRGQIFGKKLKVPKYILNKVYNCTLSFKEYIEYELDGKIPISCISVLDRKIVEKFGVEKSKTLDWELLDKNGYYNGSDFRALLIDIDSTVEDINAIFYELVKDKIKPSDYSSKMKEIYSDRLFELSQTDSDHVRYIMLMFNNGEVSLEDIVRNWNLFKDKDLSFCLLNDKNNKEGITTSELKQFMNNYGKLSRLLLISKDTNIYSFINNIFCSRKILIYFSFLI